MLSWYCLFIINRLQFICYLVNQWWRLIFEHVLRLHTQSMKGKSKIELKITIGYSLTTLSRSHRWYSITIFKRTYKTGYSEQHTPPDKCRPWKWLYNLPTCNGCSVFFSLKWGSDILRMLKNGSGMVKSDICQFWHWKAFYVSHRYVQMVMCRLQ